MNWIRTALLLVGAAVVAVALVGAGAVLGGNFGAFLILLGMGGVPIAIVGTASYHYVAAKSPIVGPEHHLRESAEAWEEELESARRGLDEAGMSDDLADRLLEGAEEALAPVADVEVRAGRVDVTPRSIEEITGSQIRNADRQLEEFLEELGEEVHPELEEDLRETQTLLGWEGEEDPSLDPAPLPDLLDAYRDQIRDLDEGFRHEVDAVADAISSVESAGIDTSEAWEHHRSAQDLWDEGRPILAIRALQDAESRVHEHMEPEFDERWKELDIALSKVEDLELRGVVSEKVQDNLDRLRDRLQTLELEEDGVSGLEQVERRFAEVVGDVHDDLLRQARSAGSDLQEGGAEALHGEVEEQIRVLEDAPRVEHPYQESFSSWLDMVSSAVPNLSHYIQEAALMRHLPRIEETVEQKLAEQGAVTPADLPVRERADEILRLYARLNEDEVELVDGTLRPAEEA